MSKFFTFKSKRGGEKMYFDGYCYNFRRKESETTYWRCDDRKCPGSATTNQTEPRIIKNHNHSPDFEKETSIKLISNIKTRALTTSEKPRDILNRVLDGQAQLEVVNLPKIKSLVDGITKCRKRINFFEKPVERSMVPEIFLKTLNQEVFFAI